MANFGVDSLRANLNTPSRTFLWDVLIPIPIGNGDFSTYQIRAQSTQIPTVSAGTIEIPYKQTAGIIVSGKKKYDHTWACTFLEAEDHLTYDALYSWSQQIVHDVAGIGVGDPLYKTDIYIQLQNVDGTSGMKLKLKGAWLQTIGTVDLNYEDQNVVKYPATFQFDRFEQVPS